MRDIQCAQCGTLDIRETGSYIGHKGEFLGEWPLYYFGAKPTEPMNADVYFCGVECANKFHRENLSHAAQRTDE